MLQATGSWRQVDAFWVVASFCSLPEPSLCFLGCNGQGATQLFPGGACRIEAADLTFFFFFGVVCGGWGEAAKGLGSPPETYLLLMVSDGRSPRDKVRLWQEEALTRPSTSPEPGSGRDICRGRQACGLLHPQTRLCPIPSPPVFLHLRAPPVLSF